MNSKFTRRNNLNDLNNLNYDGNKKYIGVGTGGKGAFLQGYTKLSKTFFWLVKSNPPPHFTLLPTPLFKPDNKKGKLHVLFIPIRVISLFSWSCYLKT